MRVSFAPFTSVSLPDYVRLLGLYNQAIDVKVGKPRT
jgi:hypothetical protein